MENPVGVSLVVLCIQLRWVSGQDKVEQSLSPLNIKEGENVTLNCNYSVGYFNGLQWYRQYPGESLTFLFLMFSNEDKKSEGRTKATLDRTKGHSSLYIIASQPKDSATYFCAVKAGGTSFSKLFFGRGTQLVVQPDIQNPQPALYQLRSPKSSNTSVCLLTDFGFYNGSIKNETVTGSEATVLEMMTMESKSYGAVTWGSKSNFTCTDAFRKDMFDFNQFSGSKCNSSHAEQGFETDRDLNLMNLSLIVLRIIFLKTVGFNLLMTLRLWSN